MRKTPLLRFSFQTSNIISQTSGPESCWIDLARHLYARYSPE